MGEYEREFFSIEGEDDTKLFHYHGFTWLRDDCDDGYEYASTELTFCQDYLEEILETGINLFMQETPETIQQYQGNYTEEEIANVIDTYYGGEPGEYLKLECITEDTPVGHYWCYLEELL